MVDETHDTVLDESFAFQTSSPQSLRQASSPQYNFKNRDSDLHNDNNYTAAYDEDSDLVPHTDDDDNLLFDKYAQSRAASTRMSSVSSFPASIIHTTPTYHDETSFPASRSFLNTGRATTPVNASSRMHSIGFRHPSSVRALQMRDEFDQSDYDNMTPQRRHKSRSPYLSRQSSGVGSNSNSPTKRMKSNSSSPLKSSSKSSNLRKEFPLVLLHCTILPPSISSRIPAKLGDSVLEAIIPQPYGKRWKILQEKVIKDPELKTRGVLIPHPRDEYELLEEKLLETLELEKPRLREGHYLVIDDGNGTADSGFESGSVSSSEVENEEDGDEEGILKIACPDCGKCLSEGIEGQRKWDVKVYAANGLMKAGAWSAAWQEMEKVDVEISVWMPEDVRREVDVRIEALVEQERIEREERRRSRKKHDEDRMREIYGSDPSEPKIPTIPTERSQAEIDGLFEARDFAQTPQRKNEPQQSQQDIQRDASQFPASFDAHKSPVSQYAKSELPISDLLINYVRLLARDQRNIAIFLLSILVLFYSLAHPHTSPSRDINTAWQDLNSTVQLASMSSSEIEVKTITSTAIAVETSTVIETLVLSPSSTSVHDSFSETTNIAEQLLPIETEPPNVILTNDNNLPKFEGDDEQGQQLLNDNESNTIFSKLDQLNFGDSDTGAWDIPTEIETEAETQSSPSSSSLFKQETSESRTEEEEERISLATTATGFLNMNSGVDEEIGFNHSFR